MFIKDQTMYKWIAHYCWADSELSICKKKFGQVRQLLAWPAYAPSYDYYDNFGVYCKKIDVNKDYNWDCCDRFLYYNLHKILLPKGVISNFHVDIIFVTFVVMSFSSERRRPTNQNKQILVNFLFWNFKSKNFFRQLLSEKW